MSPGVGLAKSVGLDCTLTSPLSVCGLCSLFKNKHHQKIVIGHHKRIVKVWGPGAADFFFKCLGHTHLAMRDEVVHVWCKCEDAPSRFDSLQGCYEEWSRLYHVVLSLHAWPANHTPLLASLTASCDLVAHCR